MCRCHNQNVPLIFFTITFKTHRRVRHHLAKDFNKVSSGLGFHLHPVASSRLTELFLCYAALLQDIEAEVRTSAVSNVAHMTFLGGSDLFLEHIAPRLRAIAADPVMEVRSKLAQTMMDCVGSEDAEDGLGSRPLSDSVILQVFKPLLEGFLSDEFAEVQLHVLNKLSRVSHLLGKMDAVVNAILAMTKAHNWRVRESVARLLPHLADALGVVFFKENLIEPWLKLLLDQVSQVRLACVTGMAHLLKVAGEHWIQKEIMPHYQTIYEEGAENYLTRMTILRCVVTLCEAQRECRNGSSNNSLQEEILGILLVAIHDSVANVRIIACQGLGVLANSCFEEVAVSAKIRPALEERLHDDDEDCRYFSQLALNLICSLR
jgi:serine/threonine-protein phosphatase 2A regulatory subunit A